MIKRRSRPSAALSSSLALHVCAVVLIVVIARFGPKLAYPVHLPGTAHGERMMLAYTLGGQPQPASTPSLHSTPTRAVQKRPTRATSPAPVAPSHAAQSEAGPGVSGDSALGDENLRVALPQVHPRPSPDLSSLPHGTAGNVIVDIVIDDTGKVTETKLVRGLGGAIDDTVVATLRQWTFAPATKDGQPVASEQEVLIHYERG